MPTQCRFIFGTCLSIGALLITAAAQQTYNSQLHRFQTETVATGLKQPSTMIFLPDGPPFWPLCVSGFSTWLWPSNR
jgi:hypothetical protein